MKFILATQKPGCRLSNLMIRVYFSRPGRKYHGSRLGAEPAPSSTAITAWNLRSKPAYSYTTVVAALPACALQAASAASVG